jgi:hypothetical protein
MPCAMTRLEVMPQRAEWVVVRNRDEQHPLSSHHTADAAVRAAQTALADDEAPELIVRDRYSRTRHIAIRRR